MNKNELALIVQEGEGYTIEFKESLNSDLTKELVAMDNREITEFIQAEGKVRFDEILRDDVDMNKLFNKGVFVRYLGISKITKTLDDYSILENLGVLAYKNQNPFLNNAGLLFFSDRLTPHLFYATITCALYKGNEKVMILDRKDYADDLVSNIEDTVLFLKSILICDMKLRLCVGKRFWKSPKSH